MLSDLATIRLGVGYKLNGAAVRGMPSEIADLEKVEVVYEDIPGWETDISKVHLSEVLNQYAISASNVARAVDA